MFLRHFICCICVLIAACGAAWAEEPAAAEPAATESIADSTGDILGIEDSGRLIETVLQHQKVAPGAPAAEAAAAASAQRISVREAVTLVLERNPQVLIAAEEFNAAAERLGQAAAQRWPQVKGGITWVYNDRIDYDENFTLGSGTSGLSGGLGSSSGLGSSGLGGLKQLGGSGSYNPGIALLSSGVNTLLQNYYTQKYMPDDATVVQSVQVSQVLYAGGRIRAAVDAASALRDAQDWQRNVVLDDLEFQVKQAYYDTLLSSALVRVAQKSIETFERNLSDAENMFDAGVMSNFEVLRARTELGARESDLVAAHNAHRLAMANLCRLLTLPQQTAIGVTASMDWIPLAAPSAELVELAFLHRPEIQSLSRAIDAAKANLRGAKGEYLPNVAASGEYQAIDGAGPLAAEGWVVSVGAEWEIAAGGRRKHERKERLSTVRKVEHQLEDLEDLIELQVTQARINLDDAMARTASEQGTVKLAEEGLRLAELRFEEGVGTQSETLDAELALTNAQTSLLQALRDFAVANAAIERAIGKSWVREWDTADGQ